MKKKLKIIIPISLITIIILCLTIYFVAKPRLSQEIIDNQNIVINNLESIKDNFYVLKKDNKYYVYVVIDNNYTCYYYEIHKSEKLYEEYKNKYRGNINAELFYDDDSLVTRILVKKGNFSEDLKGNLEEKHKGYKLLG